MRRALLLFVVAGALTLSASLIAFSQEGDPQEGASQDQGAPQDALGAGEAQYDPGAGEAQPEPGAGEAQYPQEEQAATTETGCSWQWGYRWNSAGGWEWWCYDPQLGWYYGTNEDGSGKYQRVGGRGSFMMQT